MPAGTPKRGEVISLALKMQSGSRILPVPTKSIGSATRNHVPEGAENLLLEVTVEWTVEELRAIYAANPDPDPVTVNVAALSGVTTSWASGIDGEQDVHFPDVSGRQGRDYFGIQVPIADKPAATARLGEVDTETVREPVYTLHDADAENEVFYIGAYDSDDVDLRRSRDVRTRDTVIEDDETQEVKVKGPSLVYEKQSGADQTATFELTADPPRVELPLEVILGVFDDGTTVRGDRYALSDATPKIPVGSSGKASVTLEFPGPDGNRMDEELTLRATVNVYSLASGGENTISVVEHPFTFVDTDKLPRLTVSPMEGMVEEGGSTMLELTIDRNPADTIRRPGEVQEFSNEAVTVMLTAGSGSTAGADDHNLPLEVNFPKWKTTDGRTRTMEVEIEATMDDEMAEMEMLVIDAEVDGSENAKRGSNTPLDSYPGAAMLTIEEETRALVWAKDEAVVMKAVYDAIAAAAGADEVLTEGEMVSLDAGAVFGWAPSLSAADIGISAAAEGAAASASVSGHTITVTATAEGMAEITVTARASLPGGVMILDQTDPREASIKFPVEVGLAALSIMLSGPEEMNLVEGGMSAMVTATANRAVTADVVVTLVRDRAMSSASDADYSAEPITIAAGTMAGSTMVMAVEDGVMENVDGHEEKLVLYGMSESAMVEGEVSFYLWDAAVPALPAFSALLLGGLLAVGGWRRRRR